MKADNNVSKQLQKKLQSLTLRDKWALAILCIFLFGLFGLYGGWTLHSNAKKQQSIFEHKVNDYFWLRSQSANLKEQGSQTLDSSEPPKQQVIAMMEKTGVQNIQVEEVSNGLKINFQHGNQIIINQTLTQLEINGYQFDSLQIVQKTTETGSDLTVQAVIKRS